MKSFRSRLAAVAAGSLATLAVVAMPAGAAESSPSPESIFPGCAWGAQWGSVANDETELADPVLNAQGPDSNANYWTLGYTYEPGETITLSGTYADARFQSFQVYASTAFANSTLTDYEIVPDQGSVNPFRRVNPFRFLFGPRRVGRPGEHYTVTLSSDPQPGEANTLPLGPPGQEAGAPGRLMMRDYLQTGGVWAVPAPTVTFSYEGVSKVIPACTREQETFPAGTSPEAAPAAAQPAAAAKSEAPGEVKTPFFAVASEGGVASNGDTQYIRAMVKPPSNGEVLIVKGKMPTTIRGESPRAWPQPGVDVRYWSLCVNQSGSNVVNELPDGRVDWACRHDDQVGLSPGGDYTFAVGTEAQRKEIERIPGVTFVPFSEANPTAATALLIRNMLPSPSFGKFIETWPTAVAASPGETPAADEPVLGAYYPRISFSTISALSQAQRVRPRW